MNKKGVLQYDSYKHLLKKSVAVKGLVTPGLNSLITVYLIVLLL